MLIVAHMKYLIVIGNSVYRQCVGIPMGTDCAPLLVNLFLFNYEYHRVRYKTPVIDMTFKLGPSTTNMYTTELHVCKQ